MSENSRPSTKNKTTHPGNKEILVHFKNPLSPPEQRLVAYRKSMLQCEKHMVSDQFALRHVEMTPPKLKVIKPASPAEIKRLKENRLDLV